MEGEGKLNTSKIDTTMAAFVCLDFIGGKKSKRLYNLITAFLHSWADVIWFLTCIIFSNGQQVLVKPFSREG